MNMQNSKKLQTLQSVLEGTGIILTWRKSPKLTMYEFTAPNGLQEIASGYNEAILIARGIALAKRSTQPKENQ